MLGKIYSKAMTVDNTHVSKVAAFILVSLGLFQVFYAETLQASNKSKDKINILGWVTVAVGGVYMLFVLAAGMKMMR